MLEPPDLPEQDLVSLLAREYGQYVERLEFLPLGADVDTAVYRATTGGESWFLKLRRGEPYLPSFLIPDMLHEAGATGVIPPLRTASGAMWTRFLDYAVVLYPFVDGENGFGKPLSPEQWQGLAGILRQLHDLEVPRELEEMIPREAYSRRYRDRMVGFLDLVDGNPRLPDRVAEEMAAILNSNRELMTHLLARTDMLAAEVEERQLSLVPCHGDIHAGNIMLTPAGDLYVVDWDTLVLAPRERDLMFIGAGIGGTWSSDQEIRVFYDGYGPVSVDHDAIAYYRYERIIQDLVEFCEAVLLTGQGGTDREQSLYYFAGQFKPGDVIDVATRTDPANRL